MCGIVGIIGNTNASYEVYRGLLVLQHRGQDAAGILSYDFNSNTFNLEKDLGHVANVFNQSNLEKLTGSMSIGHTRYSTTGKHSKIDIQPMTLSYPFGLGMAHNGNLVNFVEAEKKLKDKYNSLLLTGNDLEVIQNFFARALEKKFDHLITNKDRQVKISDLTDCVKNVFNEAKGGYSAIGLIAGNGLFAFRDPSGIRPLIIGRKKNGGKYAHIVASESFALNFLDYEIYRDVAPGELIYINSQGELTSEIINSTEKKEKNTPCMFEWVYFSGPESTMEKRSVYTSRLNLGKVLANKVRETMQPGSENYPDIIVPIPETSRIAAIAMAEELELPYREVLIKNRYIQRSFILRSQDQREHAVRLKLSPVKSEIAGKNVLLVDDSIVRGTTSKYIVQTVKKAGAKNVYFANTCAPIRYPCYFGIDFPSSEELIAYNKNEAEIARAINADQIFYLNTQDILEAIDLPSLCLACLDGKYPVDISGKESFLNRRSGNGVKR